MADFNIHIGSLPITYSSKVTFKSVEDCDALNNDIPIVLVSNIIEVHALLKEYVSITDVKDVVITYIAQDDANQYLKYNGNKVTTADLPLTIPVTDLGNIPNLSLIEQYIPDANITSIRIDLHVVDENGTAGPSVTSYVQASRVACSEEPVLRDPFITNISSDEETHRGCLTRTFSIDRNGSTNPIKYRITNLYYGEAGYRATLSDSDIAIAYIGSTIGQGEYFKGEIVSNSTDAVVNLIYRVCALSAGENNNICNVAFQVYKEDGVTLNNDYTVEMYVVNEGSDLSNN